LARSARDVAILLGIMAGYDPLDPDTKDVAVPDYSASLSGDLRKVRVGVPTNYFTDDVAPAVADAVAAAIDDLESMGATTVPVEVENLDGILECMLAIAMAEAAVYHQAAMRSSPELFGDETRLLLEAGSVMPASTYINAQRVRAAVKDAFRRAMSDVDVLVTPTQPATAMKIGQKQVFEVAARFCAPLNIAGLPAVSVPCGFSPDRLPIGLQIIGKPFDEATVLRVADAYQRGTDFHSRRPSIAARFDRTGAPAVSRTP
jgi:aspartyl-tRNA(Asn)/glutamyl-tRNA(Gln) amidotransferase subunit A